MFDHIADMVRYELKIKYEKDVADGKMKFTITVPNNDNLTGWYVNMDPELSNLIGFGMAGSIGPITGSISGSEVNDGSIDYKATETNAISLCFTTGQRIITDENMPGWSAGTANKMVALLYPFKGSMVMDADLKLNPPTTCLPSFLESSQPLVEMTFNVKKQTRDNIVEPLNWPTRANFHGYIKAVKARPC